MASIAACMLPAAAGPAMGTRPVPTPSLDPLLSMMPVRCHQHSICSHAPLRGAGEHSTKLGRSTVSRKL